jgi:hypothetical protein
MSQITHQVNPETREYVQIVTPETLREILDAAGDDYLRPDYFEPDDEWNVGTDGDDDDQATA